MNLKIGITASAILFCLSVSVASLAKEQVTGIGGFFFKAENPQMLATWYEEHLGVDQTPRTYEVQPWQQEAGSTVFGIFSQNTEYFGEPEQSWMINFRVDDLNAIVAQLREAGIEVVVDPKTYPNGRFARLEDPEGNPIQLWQPMGE
ncbi:MULTISPECIES: VOC family protein [Gammaproteobacteria]|uniref:VOC family protein n=1 Tax=Gammaproteobacteria TaxID=1236 RepID=UPI000DD05B84|nr:MULTISPECIES: VOC family protein [Gammaproteobacteria]RTE87076.1 VOC family protein [Aliidiomarina sp. B3213]TCZ93134.1 VOC family protein [Lysobacter sp. N42]